MVAAGYMWLQGGMHMVAGRDTYNIYGVVEERRPLHTVAGRAWSGGQVGC